MRYAKIRKMDISNGKGIGVSLFVQGCDFHCQGCFNSETWDFKGGKEFTEVDYLINRCLCKFFTTIEIPSLGIKATLTMEIATLNE